MASYYNWAGLLYDLSDESITRAKDALLSKQDITTILFSPIHLADEIDNKPHIHVMYVCEQPQTLEWAQEVAKEAGFVNGYTLHVQKKPYSRYLLHLDQPHKEQFQIEQLDIVKGFIDLNKKIDYDGLSKQITQICLEEKITEFAYLVCAVEQRNNEDLMKVLIAKSYYFNSLVTSIRECAKRIK